MLIIFSGRMEARAVHHWKGFFKKMGFVTFVVVINSLA